MSVLHLNWIPRPKGWEGLIRKLDEQDRAAQRAGLPVRFAIISREHPGVTSPIWLPVRHMGALPLRPQEAALRLELILRSAREAAATARAIVLRYPGASDLTPTSHLDCWSGRLVTEHHTDMLAELRTLARGTAGRLKLVAEQLRGRSFLSRCAGLIGVTAEITTRESTRGGVGRQTTIANGHDVQGTPLLPIPAWNGQELNLLFAAATFAPWHGLDRLIAGLMRHPSSPPIVLHLAGRVPDSELASIAALPRSVEVVMHGPLDQQRLRDVAGRCHVAIASLAMQRAGLSEGCPLKTREYLAHGMPTVLAYRDTDIDTDLPGILHLPAGEDPIAVEQIVDFARRCAVGHRDVVHGIRSFAEQRLDWVPKLQCLVEFTEMVRTR